MPSLIEPRNLLGVMNHDAARAHAWAPALDKQCQRCAINTPTRIAAFLANCAHESGQFLVLKENMVYSDAGRIARVFRRRFDRDRNGALSPDEIAFAERFVRQPQAMANYVYAHVNGNGDEASGDGWRYRGHGPLQHQGRGNYQRIKAGTGLDCVANPDVLAEIDGAAQAAAWWWSDNRCNTLADAGSFTELRARINGPAMLGLFDVAQSIDKLLEVFNA